MSTVDAVRPVDGAQDGPCQLALAAHLVQDDATIRYDLIHVCMMKEGRKADSKPRRWEAVNGYVSGDPTSAELSPHPPSPTATAQLKLPDGIGHTSAASSVLVFM